MKLYKYIHYLSLDVCFGALCYQSFFFRLRFNSPIPINYQILLFCCVWMIYLIDRLIDVQLASINDDRHRFILENKKRVVVICVVLFLIGAICLSQSSIIFISNGILVVALMVFYWLAWIKKWFNKWISKDFSTAFIYVIGVVFPFFNSNKNLFFFFVLLFFLLVLHHLKLFLHINGKKWNTFLKILEALISLGSIFVSIFYPNLILYCFPLWITLGVQLIIHYFYPSERMRVFAEMAYWSPLIINIYELL
ncbi:MAG: hypothetical protein RJA76_65 [Bacteroidota bacterium]